MPTADRQDLDERAGNYRVEVQEAFPTNQKVARRSTMRIAVRNVDSKKIPNVNVTLGDTVEAKPGDFQGSRRTGSFERRKEDDELADPERPKFVINRAPIDYLRVKTDPEGSLVQGEVRAETGDDPTYVDTYDLGPLEPGQTKIFKWSVTAVEAGPFELKWRVQAGLDGKARAVGEDGAPVRGSFAGVVSREPVRARVNFDDGETVEK